MLTDQEEDRKTNPLNPLKKAMRRRNVKTVQFAPPTYVEPSDYGATSDEEEEGGEEATLVGDDGAESQSQEQARTNIEVAAVEPLATRDIQINGRSIDMGEQDPRDRAREQATTTETSRSSDELLERTEDGTAAKSRKGTVRNTDSFFKDDGVETRKINLTPSLLRDDSSSTFSKSSESTVKIKPPPSRSVADISNSSGTGQASNPLRKTDLQRRARTRRRRKRREVCLAGCSSERTRKTKRARRKKLMTERRHQARFPGNHLNPRSLWNRSQPTLPKPIHSLTGRPASFKSLLLQSFHPNPRTLAKNLH